MCLPKRRQKTKQNKQKLDHLIKKRKDLINKDDYPRFFLQILTFMEESIKQQITSPVVAFCSCSNIPDSYVRQRFHEAYQDCSTSEKLNYLSLAHRAISNPPKTQIVENIWAKFNITIRNFFPWTTQETVRLNGFRFVTQTYQIDLRRYIVRQSRSGISHSFVLQAITEIKPQKLRFSFDESYSVEDDIGSFLEAAKLGFVHTAEIWSRRVERFDLKPPSLIKVKEKKKNVKFENQNQKKWSENFKQSAISQDGQKKIEKEPQVKRFKFTESSEEEEEESPNQKERKVRTEVSETIHHLELKTQMPHKMVITAPTTTTLTVPSLKDRKGEAKKRKHSMSLLAYEPMSRNEKNLISSFIPSYDILGIEELEEFEQQKIESERESRTNIYKHKLKQQIKCRMKLEALTSLVVLGLLDYPHYKDWNSNVVCGEVHMKLQTQNCFISSLQFAHSIKPFLFMSHLCEYNNNHFIAIKCLEEDKSYFSNGVIKVWRQKNHTQLFFHFTYQNQKNAIFLKKFLHSFEELETYLSTKLAKDSIKKYLKFGRKIDKEMEKKEDVEEDRRSNEYSYGSWQFGNTSELEKCLEEVGPLPSFYSVNSYEEKNE